ncbi:hypothetical protein CAPTEDRAFT_197186 [Capitella teleta]|uniref:G-protein coupled receptors family 1 profile domain-containing protein n=1 Tax=Capitella teleta TaxID=283909 RepID=R7UCY3_CAPTE|nr:hypothetical protein CAPTEDRAFT_197186 [Capitella teleta]|eukprot:ELU03931.1 hypothetical protein CAPTEDRAFT_197186 [Capitella teleta]
MEVNFTMDLQNHSTDSMDDTTPVIENAYDYYNLMERIHPYEMCFKYIIATFGAIGNTMSFVVLQKKTFRQSSVGFVLSALLVLDTLMLALWCASNEISYVSYHYPGYFPYESDFMCKLQSMSGFLPLMSAWSLVLLTAERLAVVFYPLKAREICTRRNVIFAWLAIALVIFFLCLPNVWDHYLSVIRSQKYCTRRVSPIHYFSYYIMFSLSFLIPSLFLLGANISIAVKLSRSQSFRRQHSNGGEGNQQSRSITAMLLCESMIFLIVNAPTMIVLEIENRNEFMELFRGCKMLINPFMSNLTQTPRSSNVDVQLEIGL